MRSLRLSVRIRMRRRPIPRSRTRGRWTHLTFKLWSRGWARLSLVGHDGTLLRPPGHHFHHVLGPHRHRRPLVRAERTQPRGDHHHAGDHRCLLLPLLAHCYPGSAEPPVWPPAEE